MSIINLKSKDVFLALTLLSLAFIMTFGNFFPVDAKNISDSYKYYEKESHWINTDPLLKEMKTRPMKIGEEFTMSSHWGDQVAYMRMANNEITIPPYQFRVLYPFIISVAMDIERSVSDKFNKFNKYRLAQLNFWAFNYLFLILSIFVFYKILKKFTDDTTIIFAILILFTSQYAVLKTASFSMLDIFSYFMFLSTLYFLINKKFVLTGIFLMLSILAKESFIIWAPALMAMSFESKDKKYFYLSLLPFIPFALVRLYYGFDALNVQYDWDVAHGEIKLHYLIGHIGSIGGLINQFLGMFFAFGILWLYIGKVNVLKKYNLKYFFLTFLLLLLVAELMLSSRIARVLAPIFPLFALIPVLYLSKYDEK